MASLGRERMEACALGVTVLDVRRIVEASAAPPRL
jgi:hypothetical protein